MDSAFQSLKKIYITNPIIRIFPYRFFQDKNFKKEYQFLQESEQWGKEQMEDWQFCKLKEIVKYAYVHVPYYKQLYDAYDFNPDQLLSYDDIALIPTISKEDIKVHFNEFISDEIEHINYRKEASSGTTGNPTIFYIDKKIMAKDGAFHYYCWEKNGYKVGQKALYIKGRIEGTKSRQYQYNKIWNYLIVDPYFLEKEFFYDINRKIKHFKPKVLCAYPSAAYKLAKLYQSSGEEFPAFQLISLSSENIDITQIHYIQNVFNCSNIIYNYGHTERVLVASKYQDKDYMGFFPQYGYFELLDTNKNVIKGKGITGEITGTSYGKAMPLIRYRTDDYTSFKDYQTIDYMKHCKTTNLIEGRKQDFIITTKGKRVSLTLIAGAHINELCKLEDMQYEQKKAGELIILGKEDEMNPLTAQEREKICTIIENIYGKEIKAAYKKTKHIEMTKSFKKKILIQNVL